MVQDVIQGLRTGWRAWRRTPVTTSGVILALGLANALCVSLANSVPRLVSNPLGVPRPDAVVVLGGAWSYEEYSRLREAAAGLVELSAFQATAVTLLADERSEIISAYFVSPDYFTAVAPGGPAGGLIGPATLSRNNVGILSHAAWVRRFGGSQRAIGREITVNGVPIQIVGVAPRGFNGTAVGRPAELFLPIECALVLQALTSDLFHHARWLTLFARLPAGRTAAALEAELSTIANRELGHRGGLRVRHLLDRQAGGDAWRAIRSGAWGLSALALVVLLVASFNAAIWWLLRRDEVVMEWSVRSAVGATPARLALLSVGESAFVSLAAGAVGGLGTAWTNALLRHVESLKAIPAPLDAAPYAARAAGALGAAGAFIVVAVALRLSACRRYVDTSVLRGRRPGRLGTIPRPARYVALCASAQVAMAVMATMGSVLAFASLRSQEVAKMGFESQGLVVIEGRFALGRHAPLEAARLRHALLDRLTDLPGVQSAAMAAAVPLENFSFERHVAVAPGRQDIVAYNHVSEGYFRTMGIQLMSGRPVVAQQARRIATVINETMARRLWPDENPVGREFEILGPGGGRAVVSGVVADTKYENLAEAARPIMYMPLPDTLPSSAAIIVRVAGEAREFLPVLRAIVDDTWRGAGRAEIRRLDDLVDDLLKQPRAAARLAGLVALAAVGFAFWGILSVAAYTGRLRQRETVIRLALGATPWRTSMHAVREGFGIGCTGALAGLALWNLAGIAVSHDLGPMATLSRATAAMIMAAAVAAAVTGALVAARRASRPDLAALLKAE